MTSSSSKTVEVLNADSKSLGRVSFQKAVRLLIKEKAVVHEADESRGYLREVTGKCREWAYPKAVRLVHLVELNYKKLYGPPLLSKHGVLKRDGYKCAYCGNSAKTIDHIMPRSRCASPSLANTWTNLVAACFKCNNEKDNKTPEEAGMKLLWQPYVPTKAALIAASKP